jgi:hypothetical protein
VKPLVPLMPSNCPEGTLGFADLITLTMAALKGDPSMVAVMTLSVDGPMEVGTVAVAVVP